MYKIPRQRKEVEHKNYLILTRQFQRANAPVFNAASEAETPQEAEAAVQRFNTKELEKGIRRIHELAAKDAIARNLEGFSNPITPPPLQIKSAQSWAELQSADDLFAEYIQLQNKTIGQKIVEIRNSHKEYLTLVVNRQIQDGFAQGLSFQQIKKNILAADKLGEYVGADADYRVRRIVATETTMASNTASYMVAEKLNSTVPMYKEWNTVIDSRARTNHVAMAGTKVPMKSKFIVPKRKGGSEEALYPGDPSLSAENVIWCRCYVTYGEQASATGVSTPTQAPKLPKMPPIPKPPKVRPKPITPKPPVNNFSYKPDGKSRFDKEFKHQYGEVNSMAEAKQQLKEIFAKEGQSIDRFSIDASFTVDKMAERIKAFERLMAEWDVNVSKAGTIIDDSLSLNFKSTAGKYGEVGIRYKQGKYTTSFNAGHKNSQIGLTVSRDGEAIFWEGLQGRYNPLLSAKSTFMGQHTDISTQVHEFAHYISSDWGKSTQLMSKASLDFWNEVNDVRTRYIGELNDLLQKANNSPEARKRANEIYLGKYAEKLYSQGEQDEFWAESFKNYYLSANPSPYAEELVEIGRKYFGKTQ